MVSDGRSSVTMLQNSDHRHLANRPGSLTFGFVEGMSFGCIVCRHAAGKHGFQFGRYHFQTRALIEYSIVL